MSFGIQIKEKSIVLLNYLSFGLLSMSFNFLSLQIQINNIKFVPHKKGYRSN
jgi:hypothetical protein